MESKSCSHITKKGFTRSTTDNDYHHSHVDKVRERECVLDENGQIYANFWMIDKVRTYFVDDEDENGDGDISNKL